MEEKGPPNVRLIKVQPVAEGESSLPPIRGKIRTSTRKKGRQALNKSKSSTVKTQDLPELKVPKVDTGGSFQDAELIYVKPINDDPLTPREDEVNEIKKESAEDTETEELNGKRKKKTKRRKKNSVLPHDVTDSDDLAETHEEQRKEKNAGEPDIVKDKKKKTKKKKSKKNKKEKENKELEPIKTKREPEQEIVAAPPAETKEKADDKKKGRKLPCCFGFIATWLAKRKQKRRDKKKRAIADRTSTPELVEYNHKKSKGGEAFVIEVDSRPTIHKPLLPPIQQSSGPIRRADYKLQDAEARRNEKLAKKKEAARKHELKKAECIERKEDAEFHFRKKARLTIRYKQADAERNRNNLSRRAITRPISVQASSSKSVTKENGPDAGKLIF